MKLVQTIRVPNLNTCEEYLGEEYYFSNGCKKYLRETSKMISMTDMSNVRMEVKNG